MIFKNGLRNGECHGLWGKEGVRIFEGREGVRVFGGGASQNLWGRRVSESLGRRVSGSLGEGRDQALLFFFLIMGSLVIIHDTADLALAHCSACFVIVH